MDRMDKDYLFMQEALKEAQKAFKKDEVPIGAVIVLKDKIIARAHNQRERDNNPLGHAELLAIRKASKKLSRWRLNDCTLYVTVEPCIMCTGALINARIKSLVYGCADKKAGAIESLYNISQDKRLNHRFSVTSNVLNSECAEIMKRFFRNKR
ncbi:MAG: tRNA adenosine(34) deaminase TadA [Thermodesulfovibrionales bacterium]|nr:tRNA adenosine(34) deaminase TadA [Thermodesulfovibrionales bacterium]